MRNIFIAALMLSCSPQAYSETFSSMTITGTMTVQGNEFSVGASTFNIIQGTVSFGGLLLRRGAIAMGTSAYTHINLGGGPSITGSDSVNSIFSAVGGGFGNQATRSYSTVGGGSSNAAQGIYSTVGGGSGNLAGYDYDTVGGGLGSIARGSYSVVSGGLHNWAYGIASIAPGGEQNQALGDYSLAAGRYAIATAQGSFLWADSQYSYLTGNTTDQFLVRAQGGFFVNSSSSIFMNGSTPQLYLRQDGNIGVGTLTPGSLFTISNDTFSVAGSGIVSAPSQPGVSAYRTSSQSIPNGIETEIYFQSVDSPGFNNNGMIDLVSSSSTIRIPSGGGGKYDVCYSVKFTPNATGRRISLLYINSTYKGAFEAIPDAAGYPTVGGCRAYSLGASDSLKVKAYQDSGGALNAYSDSAGVIYISVQKIW
ncbi:MAG: hypothetical protein AAB412_01700 [Elusimicrobiota bacterium]|mgnify:FL=1